MSSSLVASPVAGLFFVLVARVRASAGESTRMHMCVARASESTSLFSLNGDVPLDDSATNRVQILTLMDIDNKVI